MTEEADKNLKGKAAGDAGDAQGSPYRGGGTSVRTRPSVKTLRIVVQEALVLITEQVFETNYKVNFFCRVPGDWLENGELKKEFWARIGTQIFGENRQSETFPGAYYIIKSMETEVLDDGEVKSRNWRGIVDTDDDLYYFFDGSEKVTAEEFQENVDAYFQNAAHSEPVNQDEPENLDELDASLVEAWSDPEKLPGFGEWLALTRSETAQAQYAYIILKKHLARENLRLRKDILPGSWWRIGWALFMNTDALVGEAKHAEMLKALFVELVDFCEAATGENFAYHLKELLERLDDSRERREKITPLLPAKALAQFPEIDRMRAENDEDCFGGINHLGF